MTEWKSEQERETAVRVLQILSRTRKNKKGLKRKLQEFREEKGLPIYSNDSKIEETIEKLVEDDSKPIARSSEGSFYERTDSGVTY